MIGPGSSTPLTIVRRTWKWTGAVLGLSAAAIVWFVADDRPPGASSATLLPGSAPSGPAGPSDRPGESGAPEASRPSRRLQAAETTSDSGARNDISLASHESTDVRTRDPDGKSTERAAADSDAQRIALAIGEWEDDYQGKRRLSVREDGTATMVVDLQGAARKLFAPRLQFDIEWELKDGRLILRTTGGQPQKKVQFITKLYGDVAEYTILELSRRQMLLLDPDGKRRYDWRRVE